MLILFPLNISAKNACEDGFWVFEIKQIRLQNVAKFVILDKCQTLTFQKNLCYLLE